MTSFSRRAIFGAAGACLVPFALDARPAAKRPEATEHLSEMFNLKSAEGREYGVSIAYPLPEDPEIELALKGRKPVPIYTTDRWTSLGLLLSITRLMRWGGELPPCVIVAIGYPDEEVAYKDDSRAFDLTPTSRPRGGKVDPKYGGAALFRSLIVNKVQPELRRRGDFDHENSVLFGHSFGGLFAFDTMITAPGAFRHYLSVSPSLWFDDRLIMKQFEAALGRGQNFPGRFAIYTGEREERISPPETRMTSNVLEVQRLIVKHRSQFEAPLAQILPGLSHHSILGIAATYGLQFLLSPPNRLQETY